jgi:hypothetical protein
MMVQFGIDFLLNSFPTRRGLCGCDCTCMMFYSHQQWGVLYTTICLIPVVVSFVISHRWYYWSYPITSMFENLMAFITMFLKVVSDNCLLIDLKVLKLKGIKLDLNSQYTELVRYTLKWSGTTHRELYIHFVCLLSSIRFQLALKIPTVTILKFMETTALLHPTQDSFIQTHCPIILIFVFRSSSR